MNFFLKKLILKKKSADNNRSMKNYPACKELRMLCMTEIGRSAFEGFFPNLLLSGHNFEQIFEQIFTIRMS